MPDRIHVSLIDDIMDAYLEWRQQSAAVTAAYAHWQGAATSHAASAFGAYTAALDREELASNSYARLLQQSRHLHAADLQRAARLREAA
jgi:hypothetical protein